MERKIGGIFEYNGEWYQCVIGYYCNDCAFNNDSCEERERITLKNQLTKEQITGLCTSKLRSDKKPVIFKKLEKVGEPMKIHNRLVLKVKADAYMCMRCCFYSKGKCELTMQECEYYDCGEGNKFIEIKQTKEDMEGRELDPHMAKVIDEATQKMGEGIGRQIRENINKQRMKPFSLEASKAGKPVCTRDGRKARIICFDRDGDMHIVALVAGSLGEEVHYYLSNGQVDFDKQNDDDLMMLPEKKEGWVNIYKEGVDQYIYNNEKAALSRRGSDCIATIKIEWEE